MPAPVTYFKRHPLLTFRILALLAAIGFCALIGADLVKKKPNYAAVYITVYVVLSLLLVITQSTRLHYFGVSDKALVIRNAIFPWQRRELLFKDIRSVRIDIDSVNSRSLSPYYLMIFFEGLKK